ncbi:hypothetical protein D3Z46_20290 [Bacteroides sartorii]|nr:hypothetical protein [Phocaeicola sartorii]
MKNKCLVGLLFAFFFLSCSVKEDYARIVVSNLREEGVNVDSYTHIAIIPEEGCGGCISEAEHFFCENVESDIFFVFTKIRSRKELVLRLGKLLERENVLLDIEQRYVAKKEEMNIYPILIDIRTDDEYTWLFLEPGMSYERILEQFEK